MTYDRLLADRIRGLLSDEQGVSERRMFGGLAFLVDGNMSVSAVGTGGIMVRVDAAASARYLDEPLVRPVVMRGRELNGWLHVEAEALSGDEALSEWVARSVAYARSLPPT